MVQNSAFFELSTGSSREQARFQATKLDEFICFRSAYCATAKNLTVWQKLLRRLCTGRAFWYNENETIASMDLMKRSETRSLLGRSHKAVWETIVGMFRRKKPSSLTSRFAARKSMWDSGVWWTAWHTLSLSRASTGRTSRGDSLAASY